MQGNRYTYAGCDPANNIDPSGLDHCSARQKVIKAATLVLAVAAFGVATAAIPASGPVAPATIAAVIVAGGFVLVAEAEYLDCIYN